MKKQLLSVSLISVCLLCSCAQTPDNIEGNKNVGSDKNIKKVSVEHILDDFDKAFETKYTKFKLPEKSSVVINQPEEVCDLELKYVNAEKDVEWLKEKASKLAEILNVKDGKMEMTENFRCSIVNNYEEASVELFSEPYYCLSGDWDPNEIITQKSLYIDRMNPENLDEEYKTIVDKYVNISNEINKDFDGALINKPIIFNIKDYNGKTFYELKLQPTYKGVGLQYVTPKYNDDITIGIDDALMTMGIDIRFLLDSNENLYSFVSCSNYTPIKEEPLDKIISFKGACDILEKGLASNIYLELDDVKLWYEPRGTIIDASDPTVPLYDAFDGSKTTKCTPKWFFICDNEDDQYLANYVSVDCVTGEIEVFLP